MFRADSGFCTITVLDFIEQRNIPYIIACKLYSNLQASIYGITQWNAIGEGLCVSEINYQQGRLGQSP
ncbi:MAG: hypothetical protein IM631_01945 [Cytophagales bacterium]|nr:hypothetical protein [Cytophagales bacterium]